MAQLKKGTKDKIQVNTQGYLVNSEERQSMNKNHWNK